MITPVRIVHNKRKFWVPGKRDGADLGLGFFCDIRHFNPRGELLYEELGSHNMITNNGLEIIWDVFFRAATAPSTFYMELYSNTSGLSKTSALANFTEITETGYAAVECARSAVGFPTLTESSGQMRITTKECTFTAGATWTAAYGAFIRADMTADEAICWDNFASPRTLLNGDSLKVTLYVEREDPTAE